MQGGYLPNVAIPVLQWMRNVFEEGLPLVYQGRDRDSPSADDELLRASKYSRDNLARAWRLLTRCSQLVVIDGIPTESTIKTLVDSYIIVAYGVWNVAPNAREAYIKARADVQNLNDTQIREFIDRPFCSGVDELAVVEEQEQQLAATRTEQETLRQQLAQAVADFKSVKQETDTAWQQALSRAEAGYVEELFQVRVASESRIADLRKELESQSMASRDNVARLQSMIDDEIRAKRMLETSLSKSTAASERRIEALQSTYTTEIERMRAMLAVCERKNSELEDRALLLQNEKTALKRTFDAAMAKMRDQNTSRMASASASASASEARIRRTLDESSRRMPRRMSLDSLSRMAESRMPERMPEPPYRSEALPDYGCNIM